jgi:prevent-host-death family protein
VTQKNLGVAEAKRRFSELIDRVRQGERIVVYRRGIPAVALVSPDEVLNLRQESPIGLAAAAGVLSDWEDLEEVVGKIYAARSRTTTTSRS